MMEIRCLACGTELDNQRLEDQGIVHCECGQKFVPEQQSLTYVDEIPEEEYLGG